MEIALNELSHAVPAQTQALARQHISTFLQAIRALAALGVARTVRTMKGIAHTQLAPNYPIARWMNDKEVNPDERSFFKTIATKAPHLDDILQSFSDDNSTEFDFRFRGKPAIGLGVAYLFNGPAASLGIDQAFQLDPVNIEMHTLNAAGEFHQESVSVCCVVTPEQVRARTEWISERIENERLALRAVRNGQQFWENRINRWPNLVFCEGVRDQVISFYGTEPFFLQIVRHLDLINDATLAWSGGRFPLKGVLWSYESQSTMNNPNLAARRKFACPDGETRICEPHTKILGANIRIHFHPDSVRNKTYIGHIGDHLPI